MNSMIRKRVRVLAVLAVVLLPFLAMHLPQQTRAQAIGDVAPPDPDRVFSPVAFAFGQTARVNIAQVGDPNLFLAGAACGIIVNYFAADGSPLAPPFRGQVEPGKIVFVDPDSRQRRGVRQLHGPHHGVYWQPQHISGILAHLGLGNRFCL